MTGVPIGSTIRVGHHHAGPRHSHFGELTGRRIPAQSPRHGTRAALQACGDVGSAGLPNTQEADTIASLALLSDGCRLTDRWSFHGRRPMARELVIAHALRPRLTSKATPQSSKRLCLLRWRRKAVPEVQLTQRFPLSQSTIRSWASSIQQPQLLVTQ